jgi:hypothetical protein
MKKLVNSHSNKNKRLHCEDVKRAFINTHKVSIARNILDKEMYQKEESQINEERSFQFGVFFLSFLPLSITL